VETETMAGLRTEAWYPTGLPCSG